MTDWSGRGPSHRDVDQTGAGDARSFFAPLCPRGVVCLETQHDDPDTDPASSLLPGEEKRVARALSGRLREYATGRRLAHEALAQIGAHGPVLSGRFGEPIWPDGVIGSITHCPGLRAVAVSRSARWQGLGIDAEPTRDLSASTAKALVMPDDDVPPREIGLVLLLSAKEASSKALTSATGEVIDFRRLAISFPTPGSFIAIRPDGQEVAGRWRVTRGLALTVATATVTR